MAGEAKDTIYVDIDDEITNIIEKVRGSNGKVVALVLPKRASVLQSVVNMKLLKRAAENAKKHLVLVTSEVGLLPLAGSVGLHVAATPTSKPVIPAAPDSPSDEPEDIDEPLSVNDNSSDDLSADGAFDPSASAHTAVGDLAGAAAVSKLSESDIDENIDLDDEDTAEASGTAEVADAGKKAKKPKANKKMRVPNFDSFRKKIALGVVVLVVLIVGYIFAFVVLPKATITIHTDSSRITTNLTLAVDTTTKTLNTANKTIPGTAIASAKSYSQQVAASGQQNNGIKAAGSVSMSAGSCSGTVASGIDAGTAIYSNSHTFILTSSVSFMPTISKGKCTFTGVDGNGNSTIGVAATKGGADYNINAAPFTITGRSDISASGSTNGGTDNITKVVAQADIDSAKSKIMTQDTTAVKSGLQAQLQGKSLLPIPSTFIAGDPQVTSSAQAGDAADTVTVTEVINYTMLGITQSDLKTLVVANVTGQLDKGKQVILDDGVSSAKFSQQAPASATAATVGVVATSVAGPQIDTDALKKQIVGKKSGDIQSLIKETPGVTSVDVKYSPFWVSITPKNVSKVTVAIDKSNSSNN